MSEPIRLVSVTTCGDALLAVDADGRLWRYGSNFKHTETGLVQFNSWSLADGPTTKDLPKEQAHDQATE